MPVASAARTLVRYAGILFVLFALTFPIMVLEYFKRKPAKSAVKGEAATGLKSPVFNEEDERFLEKLTAEAPAPALPPRPVVILDNGKKVKGKDAQVALMDGADQVELPASPPVDSEDGPQVQAKAAGKSENKFANYWGYLPAVPSLGFVKKRTQHKAGDDLHAAAETMKAGGAQAVDDEAERKNEEQELTAILDDLNLLAVNNRAFSFSKESQKLLEDFTQVLKDIVNGVPTAYDDLEKLFKRSDKQLKETYGNLPPFLQTLVKSLPAKMTAVLAPEALAAASEKPGADAQKLGVNTTSKLGSSIKKKARIPTLKTLLGTQGAVATMLRSILNFLKLRFPAFVTGTSVLMSMAVFLLLLVLYYCWKRGRETRLAGEAASADASEVDVTESEMEDSAVFDKSPTSSRTTAAESSTQAPKLEAALNQPEPKTVPLPTATKDGI